MYLCIPNQSSQAKTLPSYLRCQNIWLQKLFSFVLPAMAAASFSVSGAVQISQGGALIHLNPIPNPANPASPVSPPMRRPSPNDLLTRMKAGEVVCHPHRKEMDVKQVTNMLNTIQRNLYLRTGINGDWHQNCEGRLHSLLQKGLQKKQPLLALEDGRQDGPAAEGQTSSDSSSDSSSSDTEPKKVSPKPAEEVNLQNNELFRHVSSKLVVAQAEVEKKDQKIAALQADFENIFTALHDVTKDLEKAESELEEKNATIRILEAELARARGYDPMDTEWVTFSEPLQTVKLCGVLAGFGLGQKGQLLLHCKCDLHSQACPRTKCLMHPSNNMNVSYSSSVKCEPHCKFVCFLYNMNSATCNCLFASVSCACFTCLFLCSFERKVRLVSHRSIASPAGPMAEAGLLEEALAKYGGNKWSLTMSDSLKCGMKDVNSMEEPISLPAFISAACRSLHGLKRVNLFLDVQLSVPDFGSIPQLGECLAQNVPENLPDSIRLSLPLPAGCRMSLVVRDMGDSTLQILKVISCQSAMSATNAAKFCRGDAYAMVFRPGPWALKKAVFSLIDRLPGYHATWFSLSLITQNMSGARPRRSQSSQWAPPDDELLAGIEYINQNAPECDSQNQQYYWILCNIKEDADSPISGWPEAKVRIMAQNKAKGMAGAQLETEFPLHTYSLKPFLAEKLLPLLYPLFMNFAFMLLGWPGVGKTPAIIIMMLAMGRYHASRSDLPTPPGWRRAKSLDNLWYRVGNIHEGVFLDDPSREKIDLADLKSFVTTEENQTCHGRYNDVKLAKNCCRAYAANDIQEEDEPKDEARLLRLSITMEEFLRLLRRTFPGDKPADIRAVLKRTVVLIFDQSALYLRLPSQKDDAPIHCIRVEDIHKDLGGGMASTKVAKVRNPLAMRMRLPKNKACSLTVWRSIWTVLRPTTMSKR